MVSEETRAPGRKAQTHMPKEKQGLLDMRDAHPRIARERRTVDAMIRLTCEGEHGKKDGLCPECDALLQYALERLEKCPFQEGKPTCADCPIHCYQPSKREEIRAVMRYAGPRMLIRHPILAVRHILDGLRKQPIQSCDRAQSSEQG